MRGIIIAMLFFFMLAIHLMIGATVVEPVGETTKDHVSDSYHGSINDVYEVVFKWGPLVWLGGGFFFAVQWYLRRDRFARRAPRR